MTYSKSKDLTKRTHSDKVLRDKAFEFASYPKYDAYQRRLASMVYKFLDKRPNESCVDAEPSYQLANELHRQIIRKFQKRKVYSSFRDNNCSVDLADIQSLNRYNKGIESLLRAIDLFSEYAWVVFLKDKRGITIINAFEKIIPKRQRPNKIWFDQGSAFYNKFIKKFLKINSIEMYLAYNEGKSDVAERFIGTLNN